MKPDIDRKAHVHIMLGGDVMLGRNVGEYIRRYGPEYPLGPVASLMRGADLSIANLECALTASNQIWPGAPKAFYFGAPPQAVETLLDAGIDMLSLANNHILDFGVAGLQQTLLLLQTHGIHHAGSGNNLDAARAPAIVARNGIKFGMAAFCDHQADFAAAADRPGIAYVDLEDEPGTLAALRSALELLQQADVDWPLLAIHWGPNMVYRPAAQIRRIAHATIDMGWKILFGHSAHVFQGIEIYQRCPIIYAAGDLVDDYYVDPAFKNDHQLLFELVLDRHALQRIRLHPLFIADCRTQLASGAAFDYIAKWMTTLCSEMGTNVHQRDHELWIDCA